MSGPSYFVDHKRGEVNELKSLLSNPKIDREPERKRDVIKKVIAYMTLGIDVSRLFSEMVMAASTKDLVSKKMVYHFLSTYARQKSDLAVLVINTLQKDAHDDDPIVRGLALRALCSLRLPNLQPYVMPVLRAALADVNPYVRKTAVVGVAKLVYSFPELARTDLVDTLYNMLRDKDTLVITNAIQALNSILTSEGGMAVNQAIILYLLNRMKEFNEWGQCVLLDLVATYRPANETELFDIMNLLEDRLRHANGSVVLATTKIFLNFTRDNKPVHEQVYRRLKAPLITIIGASSTELAFAVLSHILCLAERAPGIFNDEYKHFFARFNDPSSVKLLKLQVLTQLTDRHNFSDILSEMSEYVTDVDPAIARAVIRAVGKIAVENRSASQATSAASGVAGASVPDLVDDCIEHLLAFLDLNTDYVSAETVVVISDLLRRYPERHSDLVGPCVSKCLKMFEHIYDDKEAVVSFVWILGEYGEEIDDAPYILESMFVDKYADIVEDALKGELLTAAMKLFFKRPPEMKALLGRLLSAAVSEQDKIDVHDLALMYYRLLSLNVHEAARVVNCPKVVVDVFAESEDKETKDKIFKEFNSLSIIYNMPSERFIKKFVEPAEAEANNAEQLQQHEAPDADYPDDEQSPYSAPDAPHSLTSPSSSSAAAAPTAAPAVDLLGTDLLSTFGAPSSSSSSSGAPTLTLTAGATVDKVTYQSRWGSLPIHDKVEFSISNPSVNGKAVESLLSKKNILTFASGQIGNMFKLYLFARDPSSLFLIECIVDLNSGKLAATIKVDGNTALAAALAAFFKDAVASLA